LISVSIFHRSCRPVARAAALAVGLSLLMSGRPAARAIAAVNDALDARQVKAAFVMNFLKFVEWPVSHLDAAPAPIQIAVLGDVGFGWTLQQAAAGESVNGHPVMVNVIGKVEHAREAHLLFIGASEQPHLPAILRHVEAAPVLTVGDTEGFARAGVVLNLYTFDQRVRIEVNTTAAERAGLRLSAHLLRIARIVG
jgi:YfiR/HmsC-like